MEPPSGGILTLMVRRCIGKYEDSARKVRLQCCWRVVPLQDRRPAPKEIGIRRPERFPILRRAVALHPLVDEQQIGPGDRLVVQARDAVMARQMLQRRGEALDRFY